MISPPPRSTSTSTLVPYTRPFRSAAVGPAQGAVRRPRLPPAHRRPLRRVAPRAELSALGPQEVLRLAGRRVGTAGGGLPARPRSSAAGGQLGHVPDHGVQLLLRRLRRRRGLPRRAAFRCRAAGRRVRALHPAAAPPVPTPPAPLADLPPPLTR